LQPSKSEFPPLFSPGFHDIEIEQFDSYFIDPFEDKDRRLFLKERFFALLNELFRIEIDFEIWIDGSYATEKEKPNDIDLMFICKLEDEDKLSLEKHQDFVYIANSKEFRIRHNCDLKFAYADYLPDLQTIEYYKKLYGLSRNKEPKGIPRFKYVANSENKIST